MSEVVTATTEQLLADFERLVDALAAGAAIHDVVPQARALLRRMFDNNDRLYARLDEILRVVTAMTALDFRHKLEPREDDDWLINALAIGLNITSDELRRRAEALTETRDRALSANRAKTAFLTNMSHELRTPLNAIIGYSELLREECADTLPEHQLSDLDRVVSAGRHLLSLIKDTLDLSKIEAGKTELIIDTFALDTLIDEVVGTVLTLAESRGNELVLERSPDLGRMVTDRTRLAQILYNLLSNAIKFTTLGTIRFSVRRSADDIVFTVEDTGIGIPQDKLDVVFGAFNQADEETTRRFGGTGLGLAIARWIVDAHGGAIRAEAREPRGCRMVVELPR
jgi:signal transduction histidine kinase